MNLFFQPLLVCFLTSVANPVLSDIDDVGGAINGLSDVTNTVVNLSETMETYGIAIVALAVIFVITVFVILVMLWNNTKMMNSLVKTNEKSSQTDQAIITKLVDQALSDRDEVQTTTSSPTSAMEDTLKEIKLALKDIGADVGQSSDNHENDYQKDLVGAYIDLNMAFKDVSRATLNKLKCNRVAIYVFHNGNKSMHGLPFFKMSCVHEWTSYGNKTLRGKSHMDMPLHLYNDFIENIYKNGVYRSEDVNKSINDDPSIREFIAYSEAKALYFVGMTDDEGALAGFVVAEFPEPDTFQHDHDRNEFVKGALNEMISKIAPIICNKYIYRRE